MRERFVYGISMQISSLRRWWSASLGLLLGASVFGASMLTGCAVNDGDLQRWEKTQRGPRRLSAVVIFDKYPHELRVEAAMSLIRMQARKGQHVGIERLVRGTLDCDQTYVGSDAQDEPCVQQQLDPEHGIGVTTRLLQERLELGHVIIQLAQLHSELSRAFVEKG